MWKAGLYLLVFLCIALTASSCGRVDDIQGLLNEELSLSIGQGVSITGEDLVISFEDVTEDSRCPRNVTCVWAGRVSCVIELTHAGSSYRMTLTGWADPDSSHGHHAESMFCTAGATPNR